MKIGSKSMPYLSKIRASLATNQGRQLRPMGENGNGTFLSDCAWSEPGNKSAAAIKNRVSLRQAFNDRQEDGKSHERFISDPPLLATLPVYYKQRAAVNVFNRLGPAAVTRFERFRVSYLLARCLLKKPKVLGHEAFAACSR